MTLEDFIKNMKNLLEGNFENPLLQMLQQLLYAIMEIEAKEITGSDKGVHNSTRTDYRSGYRDRRFDTRLGTINLQVPKFRQHGYVPSFLKHRQRSEQALVSLVAEAYLNGVSTHKMKHLAESLGIENISASEVSNMCKILDDVVTDFSNKPLEQEYPVLWIDAVYEKIRYVGRVKNMAVMVIKALTLDGRLDVISLEVMENESEQTYTELFRKLQARGLKRVWLCVSDAHPGLQAAISKCWLNATWQRCKVHFMRNIMASVPKKHKEAFGGKLKKIWEAETKEEAIRLKNEFIEMYEQLFPKAIKCLDEGFEDSIQYYNFDKLDPRKISSTNTLERLNREIRRRSRGVGIFPSVDSYVRLIVSYLVEYIEDHATRARYISTETLRDQRNELGFEVEVA